MNAPTKKDTMSAVAAILMTARDVEPSPFMESAAYLVACGGNLPAYDFAKLVMKRAKLITTSGDCIHLTEKGRGLAAELAAAVERQQVKKCDDPGQHAENCQCNGGDYRP